MIGTVIGGGISIIVMTVTRAIFQPTWSWHAALLLCILMFCQVFVIARIKLLPTMAYAGSIGLLTTVIILLSGYPDLITHRLSYAAELAAWRVLNLVIGIIIASIAALFIFPLKASRTMRKNLASALSETANLYELVTEAYLDLQDKNHAAIAGSLTPDYKRISVVPQFSVTEAIFSTVNPERTDGIQPMWSRDPISDLSNKAIGVLMKLQAESTRVRNVANEAYLHAPFHILQNDRNRWLLHRNRAKRYSEAIEAMKRLVWPIVSYRLILPIISMADTLRASGEDYFSGSRFALSTLTLTSFRKSIKVMRQLADILKDTHRKLLDYPEEWAELRKTALICRRQIRTELEQTVQVSAFSQTDGLTLLSYYAFLVRCYFIWDELLAIINKLGFPSDGENQTDDDYVLPQREPQLPNE
ncbi:hypothetical protein EC973_005799 [Apophysomyces ossiformis]|uniref:DUF2421 domain-containing protein n=1 Tax=Apophysomyces ossiformis TaxID=679940 RepID=A0A8H7BIY4_9FUNG|nr:hypothetical protein EC973_005799 [Apophysomyces ossiformis]